MLDTGKIMELNLKNVKIVRIYPYPMFQQCDLQNTYSPGFPLFLDEELIGYPCGHCITDFIGNLERSNPSARVIDGRKYLYN